MADRAFS